jgi:c-di-GMP-binding flagellar brake protein YcgR
VSLLPALNQHVALSVEGSLELMTSRVEDAGETWLALAAPTVDGTQRRFEDGESLQLQWVTPRGLGVASATVRGTASLGVEVVVVDLDGAPDVVQRRRHVRADACVRIVISPADGAHPARPAIGSTLDLAGGGIRARAPSWYQPRDTVRVRLLLGDEEEVTALARVVRRIDDHVLAFEFEDIAVSAREQIVRDVFRRLRQALVARDA